MKPALSVFLLLLTLSTFAQDSLVSLSRFELAAKQKGRMLVTELQPVGFINSVQCYVISQNDLLSGEQQKAVLLKHINNRVTDVTDVHMLYIAPDDLPGVIRFLDSMVVLIEKDAAPGERLYTYVTTDDLQLGLYQREGVTDLYIGRLFRGQRSVYLPSVFSFNRRRIPDLALLLKNAAALLNVPATATVR